MSHIARFNMIKTTLDNVICDDWRPLIVQNFIMSSHILDQRSIRIKIKIFTPPSIYSTTRDFVRVICKEN